MIILKNKKLKQVENVRLIEHLQVLDSRSDKKRPHAHRLYKNVILYVSRFEGIWHQYSFPISNDQFEEICLPHTTFTHTPFM